jgi:hypothetical protein
MTEEQTKAEVKATIVAAYKSWCAGDVEGWQRVIDPDFYGFYYSNGLLTERSIEVDVGTDFRRWRDAGLKSTASPVHIAARLAGKDTAIATFYVRGTETWDGVTTVEGTWRATAVLTRHDGNWRWLHFHISPLITAPTERKA